MTILAPIESEARLTHIDMVRGYALLGVLLMNIQYWFRNPPQPYWLGEHPFPGALNLATDRFLSVWFEAKSVTMFSMLFALGLCIQRERVLEKAIGWGTYASRRLLAMLLFGLLHILLIWNGDILHLYALMGLLILPFLKRTKKTLAWWIGSITGLVTVLILVISLLQMVKPPQAPKPNPNLAELKAWAAACVQGYAQASWWEVLKFRLWDYKKLMLSPTMLFFVVFTFFNFLIGTWLWKQGAIREPGIHRARIGKAALALLGLGLAAGLLFAFRDSLSPFLRAHWAWARGLLPFIGIAQAFGFQFMALGLGAGLVWLWGNPAAARLLRPLTYVGRMAFTNYIVHSLVCTFVFYGWGLGLYNKVGPAAGAALGLALFGLQIPLSRWWLGRYRFGPLEWLWRTLTYGERQPFLRATDGRVGA
jgi:uncharacterized protein